MDRVVSMILDTPSIREVIAFPKNRSAFCPLTEAPSPVANKQMAELGLLNVDEGLRIPGEERQNDLIDSLSWVSRIDINDEERPAITAALQKATSLAESAKKRRGDEDPLFSVATIYNRTRKGDKAKRSRLAEEGELFKNAPDVKGNFFKVPSILE